MTRLDRYCAVTDMTAALRDVADLLDPHARGVAYARARPDLSPAVFAALDARALFGATRCREMRALSHELRAGPPPAPAHSEAA